MNQAILLLGGNLGDVFSTFQKVKELLSQIGTISKVSQIYQSAPWGFKADSQFLNQVLVLQTTLNPEQVLIETLSIEVKLGRKRNQSSNYESRVIDIDLLFFNDLILETENLILPHPRLHLRKFCLIPLIELNPDFIHPSFHLTVKELLENCEDTIEVSIFD